ncbi:hypothetical protein I3900191A7_22900 [Clostridium baratii]|uniref:hypothetical protein n=1 Tax=Clostridium baratii TaxID=1561 RepID=UPI0036F34E14
MDGFAEGYSFFEKNSGSYTAAAMGDAYVGRVNQEIDNLLKDMNAFDGFKTKPNALKGDIAEFWHSDTFNIDATVKGSSSRTYVDRSHDFASADVTSNFGQDFGLKYYKTGADSAKQQAKSVFERFKEYQAQGGKDSLDEFLSKRGFDNIDSILNDPIYSGQMRVIPKDQLKDATEWLQRKILQEGSKRPEQVARYQETLKMLRDKIEDGKGTQSVALTKEEAEQLARLANEGKVTDETLKELGISTEDLIKYEYVLKQAFKAGMTAATISMVLKVAPEIYKAIAYLIKNGELDEKQFQKIGFAALQGGAEGFIRGSVSAAITTACKAGLWGEAWKSVNPAIVGTVTVIAMDTMKNSFKVANGKMQSREVASELIKELFVSTCSLVGGGISQSFIGIPILGFMIGSFVGSVVGSFAYNSGYNAVISFCIDTGFTMFGLVDQNYELPDEVLESVSFEIFKYEEFCFEEFKHEEFKFKEFKFEEFEIEALSIGFLRRGVIGVQQIGYV